LFLQRGSKPSTKKKDLRMNPKDALIVETQRSNKETISAGIKVAAEAEAVEAEATATDGKLKLKESVYTLL